MTAAAWLAAGLLVAVVKWWWWRLGCAPRRGGGGGEGNLEAAQRAGLLNFLGCCFCRRWDAEEEEERTAVHEDVARRVVL
jgi:hypothetical protein